MYTYTYTCMYVYGSMYMLENVICSPKSFNNHNKNIRNAKTGKAVAAKHHSCARFSWPQVRQSSL